ncbi:MAG: metallophosphoesterase [Actinomycetales bacterium]|nr:metallophosphoesterase [Actinomycetales bacterium]
MSEQTPAQRRRFEWWHRLRPLTRRTIRVVLAFVASGVAGIAFGVVTASTEGSLGPHVAEYSTTLNGELTVHMGPLGALIVDSPLPLRLGVDALVKEIPDQLSTPDADPVAGLTADLASYSQFLANPAAAINEAVDGLVADAVGRSVVAWSLLLVLVALGRLAAHGVLRDAARSAWRQQGVPAVSITLALALVALPLIETTRTSGGAGRTSAILAGTPLADARITGRLATIVDYYGGYVVDAINDNSSFYAEVEQNLRTAYDVDAAPLAPTDEPPEDTATTDPAQPGQPAGDATGGASEVPVDGASGEPTADEPTHPRTPADAASDAPEPADGADEPVTMLLVSDLHCNVGMAPVVGAAVELSGAQILLNAGDTVMGGTSVESFCVTSFADAVPDGVPTLVADGNHDSSLTAEQQREAGWTVLSGEPVEVHGITFLGDTDPTITSLGAPTRPQRDETVLEMGNRLRESACELQEAGDPIDILLIHSPYAGRQVLEAGCAPLSISGHLHRRIGPWQKGYGVQYVTASTAGAGYGTPTIGPLQNPAVMTLIRWDPRTHRPLDYRLIQLQPDTSVSLTPWYAFPEQPQEFVDLPEPDPADDPVG